MFFLLVGGVEQQLSQAVKKGAGRCISCTSPADLVNYEKVLKVFFVPVWRWPSKDQLMHCDNCRLFFPPSFSLPNDSPADLLRCNYCAREVAPAFKYCPFCSSAR